MFEDPTPMPVSLPPAALVDQVEALDRHVLALCDAVGSLSSSAALAESTTPSLSLLDAWRSGFGPEHDNDEDCEDKSWDYLRREMLLGLPQLRAELLAMVAMVDGVHRAAMDLPAGHDLPPAPPVDAVEEAGPPTPSAEVPAPAPSVRSRLAVVRDVLRQLNDYAVDRGEPSIDAALEECTRAAAGAFYSISDALDAIARGELDHRAPSDWCASGYRQHVGEAERQVQAMLNTAEWQQRLPAMARTALYLLPSVAELRGEGTGSPANVLLGAPTPTCFDRGMAGVHLALRIAHIWVDADIVPDPLALGEELDVESAVLSAALEFAGALRRSGDPADSDEVTLRVASAFSWGQFLTAAAADAPDAYAQALDELHSAVGRGVPGLERLVARRTAPREATGAGGGSR